MKNYVLFGMLLSMSACGAGSVNLPQSASVANNQQSSTMSDAALLKAAQADLNLKTLAYNNAKMNPKTPQKALDAFKAAVDAAEKKVDDLK